MAEAAAPYRIERGVKLTADSPPCDLVYVSPAVCEKSAGKTALYEVGNYQGVAIDPAAGIVTHFLLYGQTRDSVFEPLDKQDKEDCRRYNESHEIKLDGALYLVQPWMHIEVSCPNVGELLKARASLDSDREDLFGRSPPHPVLAEALIAYRRPLPDILTMLDVSPQSRSPGENGNSPGAGDSLPPR